MPVSAAQLIEQIWAWNQLSMIIHYPWFSRGAINYVTTYFWVIWLIFYRLTENGILPDVNNKFPYITRFGFT
jgi:hypothetical protein